MNIRTIDDIPVIVDLDDSRLRIAERVAINGPPPSEIVVSIIPNAILLRDTLVHILGGRTLPIVERKLHGISADEPRWTTHNGKSLLPNEMNDFHLRAAAKKLLAEIRAAETLHHSMLDELSRREAMALTTITSNPN